MTPAIDLHSFPLRQRKSAKIIRGHGESGTKRSMEAKDIPNVSQSSIGDCRVANARQSFQFKIYQSSEARASRPVSVIRALATALSFPPDWTFSGVERPPPRICDRHVVDFNPSAARYYGLVVPRGQPGAEKAS